MHLNVVTRTRPRRRRFEAYTTDGKIIRLIRRRVVFFPTAAARQFFDGDYDWICPKQTFPIDVPYVFYVWEKYAYFTVCYHVWNVPLFIFTSEENEKYASFIMGIKIKRTEQHIQTGITACGNETVDCRSLAFLV